MKINHIVLLLKLVEVAVNIRKEWMQTIENKRTIGFIWISCSDGSYQLKNIQWKMQIKILSMTFDSHNFSKQTTHTIVERTKHRASNQSMHSRFVDKVFDKFRRRKVFKLFLVSIKINWKDLDN